MSNVDIIIPEKAADIGNFLVGRLIPFQQKRTIGPFCFIDHMGPAVMQPNENLDVPPHPHIGLSTLTYLFEGSMMHRDSLGTVLEIQPGAVNWMTAGKGVVHSERTPDYLRDQVKSLHGLQIWVALPKALEDIAPNFTHIEADQLPTWSEGNVAYKLIAGKAMGYESPVPVYSPLYMIEVTNKEATEIDFKGGLYGESGLYILEGGVTTNGQTFGTKQILITKDAHLCSFTLEANSKIYIFGGEPFEEERFIYWNFVSSERAKIDQAKEDWAAQKFDPVPGENEFVPLPTPKRI